MKIVKCLEQYQLVEIVNSSKDISIWIWGRETREMNGLSTDWQL